MSTRTIKQPRTDLAIPDRQVTMSNAITRGAQGLNLSQKRIVAMALASTDSVSGRDLLAGQALGWTVRLTASDYAEAFGVDVNTAYEQLKVSSKSLMRCVWTAERMEGKRKVTTNGPWLTLAEYREGLGLVDVTFHPRVAPHLLALRGSFTTYKLRHAAAMSSIYAWRLYECLQSWKDKGRWRVEIDEFMRAMEAPASCRADFGRLRKRVIEPAVAEITAKASLILAWEPEKAGRKVAALVFTFRPDPQGQLDLEG